MPVDPAGALTSTELKAELLEAVAFWWEHLDPTRKQQILDRHITHDLELKFKQWITKPTGSDNPLKCLPHEAAFIVVS
jgi:hypothetical protein